MSDNTVYESMRVLANKLYRKLRTHYREFAVVETEGEAERLHDIIWRREAYLLTCFPDFFTTDLNGKVIRKKGD